MVVGVKYCGGCNSLYDRGRQVTLLQQGFPEVSFQTGIKSGECDFLLAVCGCTRACVDIENLKAKKRVLVLCSAADFREARKLLECEMAVAAGTKPTACRQEKRILSVGQAAELSKTVFKDDVEKFAALTGDFSRLHTDAAFAEGTRYGRPVVHGMLVASLISSVMGMKLPGEGTLLLEEHTRFLKPVFYGERITARVRLESCIERRMDYVGIFRGWCENQQGEVVTESECMQLMSKEHFFVQGIEA